MLLDLFQGVAAVAHGEHVVAVEAPAQLVLQTRIVLHDQQFLRGYRHVSVSLNCCLF
jgi:hypothetical protein